jgi:hypothetical protein
VASPTASPTPSWAILKNGLAYFFGLVILGGGSITGPDYIINGAGIFIYGGTPAHGNLIGSWAGAAGTDAFGNAYPEGLDITVGTISGSVFEGSDFVLNANGLFIYSGAPALGSLVLALANGSGTDPYGNVYEPLFNAGVWSPVTGTLDQHFGIDTQGNVYISDTAGATVVEIQASSGAYLVYNSSGRGLGNLIASVSPASGTDDVGNPFVAGFATYSGASYAVFANGQLVFGSWILMTPLKNLWFNQGGANVACKYRLVASPPNSVEIIGTLNGSTGPATASAFYQLLPGFRPASQQSFPVGTNLAAAGNYYGQCDTSGNLTINGPSTAGVYLFHAFISLDA